MIELENFKSNLDVNDVYDVKKIKINKGVVYTGKTEYINEQIKESEHSSPLLATATLGLDNTGAPIPENAKFYDTWTDIDAQELYLNTKPTCYFIYGKPGVGTYNLGEGLAKKFNCIHLCPRNILVDEILQESPTGKTWDFNMRHNKVCTFEMILPMLKIKINSPAVQHRGYVLSDLPLVTCSKSPLYYINALYSEEAYLAIDDLLFDIICNLKKKKPKKPPESDRTSQSSEELMGENEQVEEEEEEPVDNQQADEEVEEEEDKPVQLPEYFLDSCSDIIQIKKPHCVSKNAILLEQIRELFNLSLAPDIIIQVVCPDLDLIKVRSHRYISYISGLTVVEPFVPNVIPELRWPAKCSISDFENPPDNHAFNPKYNCKSPLNFENEVAEQICNYRNCLNPYITDKLKDFDPKMVIEVDGRQPGPVMFHNVIERLILLNIPPIVMPQPLYIEEPPEDINEFWESVAEFQVISSGVVNFKTHASPWFNRCPVELKLRRSVVGNPKYAVMFFKHIYLLSSLNNFIAFNRNPRPFLKLKYLEPTCRVIVIGTQNSGKSMVSQCLSWIFDAAIINFKTIVDSEREKKYLPFAHTILSEIIATIEDARILEWQQNESDRVSKLKKWCDSTLQLVEKYVFLFIQILEFQEKEKKAELEKIQKQKLAIIEALKGDEKEVKVEDLGGDEKLKREEIPLTGKPPPVEEKQLIEQEVEVKETIDPNLIDDFNILKIQLYFLPMLDNIEECQAVLDSRDVLEYAPIELKDPIKKPALPVIGDEDVKIAIAKYIEANDLKKELEPTTEEIMTEIVKNITQIDTDHQAATQFEQMYGKYVIDGFPSDPDYWGYISDPKLTPDYTIALIENREVDQELYEYYTNADKFTKHYDRKIFLANDPLVYTKIQAEKLSQSHLQELDMQIISNDLVNDSVDLVSTITQIETRRRSIDTPDTTETTGLAQFITAFTESIEKFREDWDSIKVKLDEKSKCYIEVELQNKSDVDIIEEMLLKVRQSYRSTGEVTEDEEDYKDDDEEDTTAKDLLTYNDSQFYCETNIYCPVAFYDYGVLWEGKPEFSFKYDNKMHYFCNEQFLELFRNNMTKYQFYNKPYKKLPTLKICVIGAIGSGKTRLSKKIAKELGLLHIDFTDIINDYMMPRHFKKVGRCHENIFLDEPIDEEAVVEFQMDEQNENFISDVLGNEKETRRIVHNYFERGTPILPKLMQKIITKIWFDPFLSAGFVLDGYPRIPNDVEDMLACYCIPDLVIDLENNSETVIKRLTPVMMKTWKLQQNDAKIAASIKLDNERKEWMDSITKKIVIKLIVEEVCDNIFNFYSDTPKRLSNASMIIDSHPLGSPNVDPMLFNAYNDMIQQFPEPQTTIVWEKNDEARERIESRIEGLFDIEDENVQNLKDLLIEQRIKSVTIDATKSADKVLRLTLARLISLKNRCESFFEQTFIVDNGIAEILLSKGYYFFSKFHRLCPVYISENPSTILNTYKIGKRKGKIFPVVHRSNIYFISSEDNVIKFRKNPLKYITDDAIKSYFEYPLRIAVIGTPKSGQSTLAAKLAKRYGLICISRGKALRSVLEDYSWTTLGELLSENLLEGKKIDSDHIVKAIQTLTIDHRTVTYGFVFDGLPATPYEANGLLKNGLFPNIIFDLQSNEGRILQNSQKEIYYDILKYKPPYPLPLIQDRYDAWTKNRWRVKSWIAADHQNLYTLDGNQSKWHVLQQATDHIDDLSNKIHFYVSNVEKTAVRVMWISNESFEARQSQYKTLCPVCFHKKIYRHMGYPGDKKGVIQYENKFYWICQDHLDMVLGFPHLYLSSNKKIIIPELPAVIKIVDIDYIYEGGVCVVTYADNLPAQKIIIGTNEFAASYANKSYLFCSETCLNKFLEKPHLYKDITVFKETKMFPKLFLKKLPNIGYLEQTLGNLLTEACCAVNVFRPKYPGLSFQTSALIHIGLYLKTHNPAMSHEKLALYLKALKIFEARCKLMLSVGLRLRSMDNPFASYPKCHHENPTLRPLATEAEPLSSKELQKPEPIRRKTSNYVQIHKSSYAQPQRRRPTVETRRVPVPDERFDYLCEFHKPVSKVPAFLNVVDIAGLVKGAAEGQGLGNAFLSHIKACDAIFNLCRAFDDEDVIHVDGDVNPVRDLETIGEELRLKDEEQLMQNFEKLDRVVNRGGDKKLKPEYDALTRIKTILVDEKKHIRFGDWSAADIEVLNKYLFLTSKPALYLVNLSEKDYIRKKNKWLPKLKEWIDKNDPGAPLIPFSGVLEMKLLEMDPTERQAFLKEHNITSALDKIIVQGYKALQLEYFFTAGPDEVKAWTIQKGTKAPQAAGRIHTDFEKGFIMAEVMHFKDFKEEGTEAACKAAGKYRQQGRNYVVEDGDIIFFKFNAGAGLKDAKKK